jgi:hypothetical protein
MMEKILDRIIELNQNIDRDTEELKNLKQQLIDSGFEKEEYNGYQIYTTTRLTPTLKEGVSEVDIMMDFPDVIKVVPETKTIDMKLLSQLPSAQKLLEIKESKSVTVKAKK